MATQAFKKLAGSSWSRAARSFSSPRSYSIYVPDYLELSKPKIPLYPIINVQLKSFNFPVLESYQKFIDVLAENLDIDLKNSWAFPPKSLKISKYKPKSTTVSTEYSLQEYQRHLQIEPDANRYPIFLRALEASLPTGVTLVVEYYDPEHEAKRYVPDTELLTLKGELQTIGKDK